MIAARLTLRSILLSLVLLSVGLALLSARLRATLTSLSKTPPHYHPPKPHPDLPSPKSDPEPLIEENGYAQPAAHALNENTESDPPAEDDDIGEPGDESRPIYELGRIPDPKAEEESNGDDWMESYEPGVNADVYKHLQPEEDGNKVFYKPPGKGYNGAQQETLKEKTPLDRRRLRTFCQLTKERYSRRTNSAAFLWPS